ncbi:MAG TPA: YtxH domain-containing protein [Anaerolineae bacterium]|nr:YtxH domain-containing protein [Anaerolineae bacterium]
MNRFMAFAAGALCGALVGAVVALLLTPMSGAEMQEQARTRFDEIVEEGRKAAEQRRAELERQLRQLQGKEPA